MELSIKTNSSKSKISFLLIFSLLLLSCNKEGPGGRAIIQGAVLGADHDFARSEITSISFTNGDLVEHGDYLLLNTPDLGAYYYIWYDNPTWITNGDPSLQGRTGISVTFNYSDSNLDIANNTRAAIEGATNAFIITQFNDVLTITNNTAGHCPDAEDASSPFDIEIDQQGQDQVLLSESAMLNERVYIKYGDSEFANDDVQTLADGKFRFTGLTKGTYTLYVFTKDTVNGGSITTEQTIEVSGNKDVITIDDFHITF